jgi:hypothetical protein
VAGRLVDGRGPRPGRHDGGGLVFEHVIDDAGGRYRKSRGRSQSGGSGQHTGGNSHGHGGPAGSTVAVLGPPGHLGPEHGACPLLPTQLVGLGRSRRSPEQFGQVGRRHMGQVDDGRIVRRPRYRSRAVLDEGRHAATLTRSSSRVRAPWEPCPPIRTRPASGRRRLPTASPPDGAVHDGTGPGWILESAP